MAYFDKFSIRRGKIRLEGLYAWVTCVLSLGTKPSLERLGMSPLRHFAKAV